jgi:hypothetical protein
MKKVILAFDDPAFEYEREFKVRDNSPQVGFGVLIAEALVAVSHGQEDAILADAVRELRDSYPNVLGPGAEVAAFVEAADAVLAARRDDTGPK